MSWPSKDDCKSLSRFAGSSWQTASCRINGNTVCGEPCLPKGRQAGISLKTGSEIPEGDHDRAV